MKKSESARSAKKKSKATTTINLALLIDMCGYFGMTEDEILELRDMGYSYDEIEEFMMNPSAFQETLMFEEI